MILLRSLVYFIFLAVTVLLYGSAIVLFNWALPKGSADRIGTAWGRVNIRAQRLICGLKVNLVGAENLPHGRAIVMSKHQSTWETIALRGLLMPHQSWVLKKELLSIPIFGRALIASKAIPIDRKAGRRAVLKVIEDGLQRLAENRVVVIFPEGTRTAPGQRQKYGLGGALLAEKAKVPVVPIAHNAGVFWRRRGVKKYPGTIEVRVGEAISCDGLKAAAIMDQVETWIEGEMKKLPETYDRR
jgi:1-acyl-sn-glycerol-3-phosphate acyltransferase